MKWIKWFCIRYFSSEKTYLKWVLSRSFGRIQLNDGTWAVNQSAEFHAYCYGKMYKDFKALPSAPNNENTEG